MPPAQMLNPVAVNKTVRQMNSVVFIVLGLFGAATVALWIYAFRDLARNTMFSEGSKTLWFVIILLGPVGGSVAYLSAKKISGSTRHPMQLDWTNFSRNEAWLTGCKTS
ncbi:MAG TPA: PLD nuclease N-terminal domain-containing protein [Lacunisphaera sp.]|jgi:hypothetical protein